MSKLGRSIRVIGTSSVAYLKKKEKIERKKRGKKKNPTPSLEYILFLYYLLSYTQIHEFPKTCAEVVMGAKVDIVSRSRVLGSLFSGQE